MALPNCRHLRLRLRARYSDFAAPDARSAPAVQDAFVLAFTAPIAIGLAVLVEAVMRRRPTWRKLRLLPPSRLSDCRGYCCCRDPGCRDCCVAITLVAGLIRLTFTLGLAFAALGCHGAFSCSAHSSTFALSLFALGSLVSLPSSSYSSSAMTAGELDGCPTGCAASQTR